jgi:hypothetical protein
VGNLSSQAKRIIGIVLFICCWLVISRPIGAYLDNQSFRITNRLRSVFEGYPLSGFNVISVERTNEPYPYKVSISSRSEMTDHLNPLPGESFLIPQGEEQRLNEQLAHEGGSIASFLVKQLPSGQQVIVLKSSEGIDRSWYIADSNSATPLFYSVEVARGRETPYAFGAIIGLFVTALLWMSALWIAYVLKSKCLVSS